MVSICSSTHPPTDHHFWGVQCAVCVQTNSTNATATPHCTVATACTAGASYASLLQQLETPRHDDAIQLLQQAHRLDNDDVGIQTSLGDAHVRAAAELVGTCTAASLLRNRDPPPFSLSGQLFICSRRFPDSRFSPPLTYCQPTQSHCQIHFHTTTTATATLTHDVVQAQIQARLQTTLQKVPITLLLCGARTTSQAKLSVKMSKCCGQRQKRSCNNEM